MRTMLVEGITHALLWIRGRGPLDCWIGRTAAHDAIRKGASMRRALARGITAGTTLPVFDRERRHGR